MLTDEERQQRIERLLAEESQADPRWWYLSFVDPDRPEGSRFLGVCWVKAGGPTRAIQSTHAASINPGGEVAFIPLAFRSDPPENSANKLHCDKDEIDRLCQLWKDQEDR